MGNLTSLQGPVEKQDGKLTLLIPLEAGGDQFIECCRNISEIQGGYLKITIPEWLAGMLRIEEGDLVRIDNPGHKLNIYPIDLRPLQSGLGAPHPLRPPVTLRLWSFISPNQTSN